MVRFIFLAGILTASSLHGGGVYWTDRGARELKRMNFDGSDPQTISLSGAVTSPGANVRGIAVDIAHNQLFWADNGADQILRANFDGSASVILHTIAGSSFPADVHLDPLARRLYWCDQTRGHIERSDFDGASLEFAVSDAAPSGPYFMDLDLTRGKIYWGDFGGGSIYRANPDGSQRETLLTGNNNTRGLRVDPAGQMLYWVNRDDQSIHRVPLAAFANGTIPLTDPAVQTLYDQLDTPHGLTIDLPASKLYWADTGTNFGDGQGGKAVSRGDLDGSGPQEVLAAGNQPWDVELDRRCRNYEEWRGRCFRADAPPGLTAPEADAEADGLKNLLEYLFDLAPLHTDAAAHPRALLVSGPLSGASYLAMKFRRRTGTTDLVCYVQVSNDLTRWEGSATNPRTVEVEVTPLDDGMEEVLARTVDPVPPDSNQFMRVVAELKNP